MSTQSPFGGRTAQAFPTLPRGDVLGTYDSYPEAQRVVAKLAESDFPVAKLSIVGNDLKTVERVTGKMTYGRAALAGALSGLWLGFFIGIVLTLFSPSAGGLFAAAALIGAGFGVLYGIVSFAITKRQRDFTSVHQVLATTYQIVVDPQLTGQAQRILGQVGAATPHTPWDQPAVGPSGPGQYGQQGQQGQAGQYGQPGRYGQPGPGQSGQGQPGQGQPGQYGQGQLGQSQYGQPGQQQPWRPGPGGTPSAGGQQGSPYGDHATPHQRPEAERDAGQRGSAPADTRSGSSAVTPPSTPSRPQYGTNDGARHGEGEQPRATPETPARTTGPRYGTNDGPRYGEGEQRRATPPTPERTTGPQYGEKVDGPTTPPQDTAAPTATPSEGDDRSR